jgi:hypothetical protein
MAMNARSRFLATPKEYRPTFVGCHFVVYLFEVMNDYHFLREPGEKQELLRNSGQME